MVEEGVSLTRRTLINCLIMLAIGMAFCIIVEYSAILKEKADIESAVRISANYALSSFESLEFGKTRASTGVYNVKSTKLRSAYQTYLDTIKLSAKEQEIYDGSDISVILDTLQSSLDNYATTGTIFTPSQFGYAFLEDSTLQNTFNESVEKIIDYKYSEEKSGLSLAFTGPDRVGLRSVKAEIVNGPYLLNLSNGYRSGRNEYKTYASIFGTARKEALKMIGKHESSMTEYDYVIAYDVKFTVGWEHRTVTPLFKVPPNKALPSTIFYNGVEVDLFNERNQLIIQEPEFTYIKRYIITN